MRNPDISPSACRRLVAVAACLGTICLGAAVAPAAYLPDGGAVCTAPGLQSPECILDDGTGGVIVVWRDERAVPDQYASRDIYAQRLDRCGEPLWTPDGVPVTTAAGLQWPVAAVADGAGGVIIAWQDSRSDAGDIRASRIGAAGTAVWSEIVVCGAAGEQEGVKIAADAVGGAYVAWTDWRAAGRGAVFIQRLSAAGAPSWTVDGAPVWNSAFDQRLAGLVADGAGGAIVAWTDRRAGNDDLYAQRLSGSRTPLWAVPGVPVCAVPVGVASFAGVVLDGGGGCTFAWTDTRTGPYRQYGQRVDLATGAVLWQADGVDLAEGNDLAGLWPAVLVGDGGGGTLLVYAAVSDSDLDVFAQRQDQAGEVLWSQTVGGADYDQDHPAACRIGDGTVVVAWRDARGDGLQYDLYAQRLGPDGQELWRTGGAPVCTAANDQLLPRAAAAGADGFALAWTDDRDVATNEADAYATVLAVDGRSADCRQPTLLTVADVPRDQGGRILLHWTASSLDAAPGADCAYYSAWRRLDAGKDAAADPALLGRLPDVPREFRGKALRALTKDYAWEWLANIEPMLLADYAVMVPSLYDSVATDTGWQSFMIVAHTASPAVFHLSNVLPGYSVDNLPPAAAYGLVGAATLDPDGIDLAWHGGAETDFAAWRVHRGPDEWFEPSPANLAATTLVPAWRDAAWSPGERHFYKIVGVDVHGNPGAAVLLRPSEISGVGGAAVPGRPVLARIHPNPFNPATALRFAVPRAGRARLIVCSVSGRIVRTVLDGDVAAGWHEAAWDGTDAAGRSVASGTYFFRLEACGEVATGKVVLLR